jgi:2-polyprenyl-6-methoxyphenol hydroxylase-like FAD-dependent oxidoreductase
MINIIGAGLGGLALAQGLMRRGIACRVIERDANGASRAQGYRISLDAMGRAALGALLPPERFERALLLEAKNVGRGFCFAKVPERPLLRMRADAWTVCRPSLRAILAEDVPIEWNRQVRSLADLPTDGLVVGADGVGSAVREALRESGVAVPIVAPLGVRVIAGYVPRNTAWDARLPLNRAGAVQYLGPRGQTLFVSFCEKEDRSPMILWALSQRGDVEGPAYGWDPTLRALLDATTERAVPIDLHASLFEAPKRRLHPRITLLGDAAHAMPPQRGMGGNSAFEDARRLVDSLDDVAAYEREMFTRTKVTVEDSLEAAQLCHLKNPVARGVRDAILWTLGATQRHTPH